MIEEPWKSSLEFFRTIANHFRDGPQRGIGHIAQTRVEMSAHPFALSPTLGEPGRSRSHSVEVIVPTRDSGDERPLIYSGFLLHRRPRQTKVSFET